MKLDKQAMFDQWLEEAKKVKEIMFKSYFEVQEFVSDEDYIDNVDLFDDYYNAILKMDNFIDGIIEEERKLMSK